MDNYNNGDYQNNGYNNNGDYNNNYNNNSGYQNNDNGNYGDQNGQGIASMVLGIVGIVSCIVICSILALVYSSKQNAVQPNGFATAGKIMGIIGIVLWAISLVIVIAFWSTFTAWLNISF